LCPTGGMPLVISIPAQVIDTGDTVASQADTQHGTKLNWFVLFATDDGPHMRLVDADYAIITAPGATIKHLLLLEVKV